MSEDTLIFMICAFCSQIRTTYNENPTIPKDVFDKIEEINKELYDTEIISYKIRNLLHDLNCTCYEAMIPFIED